MTALLWTVGAVAYIFLILVCCAIEVADELGVSDAEYSHFKETHEQRR